MQKMHTWYKVIFSLWVLVILYCFIFGLYSLVANPGSDNYIAIFYGILWLAGLLLFHNIVYNGIYINYYKQYQQKNNIKKIEEITALYKQKIITEQEYNEQIKKLKDSYMNNISQ